MRLLLLAAGVTILAIVLHVLGVHEIVALVRRSGPAIAAMIVLYAAHIAVRAWVIWRSLPPSLTLWDTLRIRFAAEAVETLTFTGPFLAEPAKGWMFVRRGVPGAQAAGVIAFEYLTYTFVAVVIALGGLVVLLRRHAFPPAAHGAVIGLAIGLTVFAAGVLWAAFTGIGLLAPAARFVGPLLGARRAASVVESVTSMEAHLLGILHRRPSRLAEALVAQFVGHALLVVEILILFRAFGFHGPAADAWIVEGGVKFINTAFVFVPGQLGAAEGANALIVAALGYPAAVGVALTLLRRVRASIVAAPGLALVPRREFARR